MIYNIYINQVQALELGLDVLECLIIETIDKAQYWADYTIEDNKKFFYLTIDKIKEQVPLIGSEKTIRRKLDLLYNKGFINYIKVKNKKYYTINNDIIKNYYIKTNGQNDQKGWSKGPDRDGQNDQHYIYNYNNINNNIYKEKEKIKKEKENSKPIDLEEFGSEKDINIAEDILNYYIEQINSIGIYNKKYHKKKLALERINKALKKYNVEELKSFINNYVKKEKEAIKKGFCKMAQYFFGPIEKGSKIMFFEEYEKIDLEDNKQVEKEKINLDDFI